MRARFPSYLILTLTVPGIFATTPASAENIDPAGSGNQYAWQENGGWLDLEVSSQPAAGVTISGTPAFSGLSGYAWHENFG